MTDSLNIMTKREKGRELPIEKRRRCFWVLAGMGFGLRTGKGKGKGKKMGGLGIGTMV